MYCATVTYPESEGSNFIYDYYMNLNTQIPQKVGPCVNRVTDKVMPQTFHSSVNWQGTWPKLGHGAINTAAFSIKAKLRHRRHLIAIEFSESYEK